MPTTSLSISTNCISRTRTPRSGKRRSFRFDEGVSCRVRIA
jgi:hypothetical protein